jgi:predicted membrane protein
MAMFTEWLFYEILRIPSEYITGIFLTDLINLILLPTIVLIIFLNAAAHLFLSGYSKKWQGLVAVVFYLVIITQGWYGPIAIMVKNYVILFLIFAGILFFIGRFITPKQVEGIEEIGKGIGGPLARAKMIRELQREKKYREEEIKRLEKEIARIKIKLSQTTDADKEILKQELLRKEQEKSLHMAEINRINWEIQKLKSLI